jgi:uncharacterized protein (TIGR02147 family)
MIDVFDYTNYRTFLRESYDFLKKNSRAFSYRYFANKCGYKSPNFLKLVIDGERNLSEESISKFQLFFKFNKSEAEYFSLLVLFDQAKKSEDKERIAKKILKLSTFKRLNPISLDQFEYYANWYHVAIREILATKRIKLDALSISKLLIPKVSEVNVEKSIALLLRLNLIKKVDNRYIQSQELLSTGNEVSSVAVASFHKEMLMLAGESIDSFDRKDRDISCLTISISEDSTIELKKLIQNFRKNVLDLSAQDKNKKNVYQVGIQMFPLNELESDS